MTNRREFLNHLGASAAALAATSALPNMAFAADKMNSINLYGPPVGPSVTLSYIAKGNALASYTDNVNFKVYKNPDLLRVGFVSGDWQLAVTPSYVAANLANKGLPVKMLNIMTWGMLYVMSLDENVTKLKDLKGEKIGMFFKNDMPDLVFNKVMKAKGLNRGADYDLHYSSTPMEAVQMLISGRVKHTVLPEPAATAAMVQAKKMFGKDIFRAISLQDEWAIVNDGNGRFPMAGVMVHEDLLNAQPEFVDAFHQQCVIATDWVNNNHAEAAKQATDDFGIGAPIIQKSIPKTNLATNRARDIKDELAKFYELLAEENPKIIGGKLPADSFYI
ncbi:MAG: ABC transporter substrate-binding protein [Alphaproteobacteria bacterium]|nr:ABC transporter substrate-binding protein [Alphaproteobacteria bacterium]